MNDEYRYQLGRWFSAYCHFANRRQDIIDGACLTFRRPWWWLRLLGWKVIDKEAGK